MKLKAGQSGGGLFFAPGDATWHPWDPKAGGYLGTAAWRIEPLVLRFTHAEPVHYMAAFCVDSAQHGIPQRVAGYITTNSDYMPAGQPGTDQTPGSLTRELRIPKLGGGLMRLRRQDFQVRIRRFCIALREADGVLSAAPGLSDAVSWIAENRLEANQPAAPVVPQEARRFSFAAMQEYVVLDRLPSLRAGKSDGRVLLDRCANFAVQLHDTRINSNGCGSSGILSAVLTHRVSLATDVPNDAQRRVPVRIAGASAGGQNLVIGAGRNVRWLSQRPCRGPRCCYGRKRRENRGRTGGLETCGER